LQNIVLLHNYLFLFVYYYILYILLIRYIKFNKKQIKINDYEEKLFSALKYVNYLKESKHEIFYKKVKNTKVSFITTIFNQENYLSSFIFSVQNQKLKEYELIFVDDNSSDNGIKIINKIKEKDKRIKLIRNKINKGAFYSRYIGQLNSKSNYNPISYSKAR
jgi:cellulose synthase/poly-beta-1,6-N-acetylglucosamine synthase-like glycosyltransferase